MFTNLGLPVTLWPGTSRAADNVAAAAAAVRLLGKTRSIIPTIDSFAITQLVPRWARASSIVFDYMPRRTLVKHAVVFWRERPHAAQHMAMRWLGRLRPRHSLSRNLVQSYVGWDWA